MNLGKTNLIRLAATAALGVGLMGTVASCGENPTDVICDPPVCEKKGFAEGNASITGVSSVDGFFTAALNFTTTANEISGNIKAELDGIKADLELGADADADIGAAIEAKLMADFMATVKVEAQPAQCAVDAHASIEASAKCQAEAKCTVEAEPGKLEFECKGGCEVQASATLDCGASATAECKFKGPEVACSGTCSGTCTVEAGLAAGCTGSCTADCMGKCDGTCGGMTGEGIDCAGACEGTCTGTCTGECRLEASANATCEGKCAGECTATGPMLDCTGAVEAHCNAKADASFMCNGSCDGEFEPPMVSANCEAKASCDAQAKAEASVKVECTPPSVDVKVAVAGTLSAEAQAKLDFKVASLKARLPRLLVSLKKGTMVFEAGADLAAAGKGAVDGALKAFSEGDVSVGAKYKLVSCAPKEFKAAGEEVASATTDLQAQVEACAKVTSALGG